MRDKLGQFFNPGKSACKVNSSDDVIQGKNRLEETKSRSLSRLVAYQKGLKDRTPYQAHKFRIKCELWQFFNVLQSIERIHWRNVCVCIVTNKTWTNWQVFKYLIIYKQPWIGAYLLRALNLAVKQDTHRKNSSLFSFIKISDNRNWFDFFDAKGKELDTTEHLCYSISESTIWMLPLMITFIIKKSTKCGSWMWNMWSLLFDGWYAFYHPQNWFTEYDMALVFMCRWFGLVFGVCVNRDMHTRSKVR